MKYLFLLIIMSLVTGCSTSAYWVQKRSGAEKGGIVGYKSRGLLSSMRENDARDKMNEYCSPDAPEILSENYQSVNQGYTAKRSFGGDIDLEPKSTNHQTIDFRCTKREPASATSQR